jgi:hypothetical protein
MKTTLQILGLFLRIPTATLLGNWVGGQIRSALTGEPVQTLQFKYQTKQGRSITNTPVATKLYPGVLFALIGKPRWAYALLGGLLTGAFVPDRFEQYWLERIIEPLIINRVPGTSGEDQVP